jgi:hypothetical protein
VWCELHCEGRRIDSLLLIWLAVNNNGRFGGVVQQGAHARYYDPSIRGMRRIAVKFRQLRKCSHCLRENVEHSCQFSAAMRFTKGRRAAWDEVLFT